MKHRQSIDAGKVLKSATVISINTRRVTRLMTTDAPRRAVFATAELLEKILLCLPPTVIVGATRTCRQFRDIVTTSKKIQEHVFLRRPPDEGLLWQVQPRLRGTAFVKIEGTARDSDREGPVAKPITLHPLLQGFAISFHGSSPRSVRQRTRVSLAGGFIVTKSGQSWRNMYISNPPVTVAYIRFQWDITDIARGIVYRTVEDASGLTFDDLVRAAMNQKCDDRDYLKVKHLGRWNMQRYKDGDGTTKSFVESLEQEHDRQARWTIFKIDLIGAVEPTAEEWKQIRKTEEAMALDREANVMDVDRV